MEEVSQTEINVIRLKCRGLLNKQVAHEMHRSTSTIRSHMEHIYRKLHIHSIGELVTYAYNHHLIHFEHEN